MSTSNVGSVAVLLALALGCGNASTSTTPEGAATTSPSEVDAPDGEAPRGDGSRAPDAGQAAVTNDEQCVRYLACLAVASPSAYPSAVTGVGRGSTCWETAESTASCNRACDSAYVEIQDQCECNGSTCTLCDATISDIYRSFVGGRRFPCDDGTELNGQQVKLTFDHAGSGPARPIRGAYVSLGGSSAEVGSHELAGTLACSGPFSLAGVYLDRDGYAEDWKVEVARVDGLRRLSVTGSVHYKFTSGHQKTCPFAATLDAH